MFRNKPISVLERWGSVLEDVIKHNGQASHDKEIAHNGQRFKEVEVSNLVERENEESGDQHPYSDVPVDLPVAVEYLERKTDSVES